MSIAGVIQLLALPGHLLAFDSTMCVLSFGEDPRTNTMGQRHMFGRVWIAFSRFGRPHSAVTTTGRVYVFNRGVNERAFSF